MIAVSSTVARRDALMEYALFSLSDASSIWDNINWWLNEVPSRPNHCLATLLWRRWLRRECWSSFCCFGMRAIFTVWLSFLKAKNDLFSTSSPVEYPNETLSNEPTSRSSWGVSSFSLFWNLTWRASRIVSITPSSILLSSLIICSRDADWNNTLIGVSSSSSSSSSLSSLRFFGWGVRPVRPAVEDRRPVLVVDTFVGGILCLPLL